MNEHNDTTTKDDMKVVRNKIHEFNVESIDGSEIKFQKFKGQKILIVNLPSACDYSPQYEELEQLYKDFQDKLVVVGFPAKNFGRQEPAASETIMQDCVKKYGLTFPVAKNISVKGKDIHPIYRWLLDQNLNEAHDNQVSHNFQKYLIDQFGKLVGMFPSGVSPTDKTITEAVSNDHYRQSHTL